MFIGDLKENYLKYYLLKKSIEYDSQLRYLLFSFPFWICYLDFLNKREKLQFILKCHFFIIYII